MEHCRVTSRLRAIIPIVAALILVAGAAPAAPRSSGWSIQPSPNPPGSQGTALSAVSCDPSGSCTAVGQYGTGGPTLTLAERWNGSTWTIQPTPNPSGANALLTGISCPGRYSCTAVGYRVSSVVRPLVERWNGVAWSIQSVPIPPQSFWAIFQSVSCTARTACTAVGGVIGNGVDAQERPLGERWDGTAWTIEPTPNPHAENGSALDGVDCTGPSACEATAAYAYADVELAVFAMGWNGTPWTIQPPPDPAGATDSSLNGVACTSASACVAVGSSNAGGVLQTLVETHSG